MTAKQQPGIYAPDGSLYITLTDGAGNLVVPGSGTGDVAGPASSTDNAAARFDLATGKLLQNSALIIADTTAALSRSGNGGISVQGTNTNDSAAAGNVGEYIESVVAQGSAVALTTNTGANITSISLTAGDWNVFGDIGFSPAGGATLTRMLGGVNSVSATTPTRPAGGVFDFLGISTTSGWCSPVGVSRVSISATTTYYLTALAVFGSGTCGAYGIIAARRAR